jgi:hypothetical protein
LPYELQFKTDGALTWGAVLTTSSSTIGLTGLNPGTVYDVRVRARDSAPLFSSWRDQENVITTPPLPAPEIRVEGNGNLIDNNDSSPSTSDDTAFGSVQQGQPGPSKTFTVRNTGNSTLTLGSPSLPPGFVLVESLVSGLGAGGSDTFTVQLQSSTVGPKAGQVIFSNNDSDENPFRFAISGTVTAPPTGTIRITVKNGPIGSAPPAQGAVVQRYNSAWQYQDAAATDASGRASWSLAADVDWNFEAYYVNPVLGSGGNTPPFLAGRLQPEYWGNAEGVEVGNGGTQNEDLLRKNPVITPDARYPWLDVVIVRRTDSGAVLPPGERVVAGTELEFTLRIINHDPWGK